MTRHTSTKSVLATHIVALLIVPGAQPTTVGDSGAHAAGPAVEALKPASARSSSPAAADMPVRMTTRCRRATTFTARGIARCPASTLGALAKDHAWHAPQ
jgi:hypothetical protein